MTPENQLPASAMPAPGGAESSALIRRFGRTGLAWSVAALPLVYAVVCVVAPWLWWDKQLAAPRPGGGVTFFTYDQYHYTVPAFRYAANYLRRWQLPLWTPQQLSGEPFLAAQLHGILYPLHWLIAWLPLVEVWRLLIFAHAIVAMAGAYWCARVFGASRPAAALGGVAYAFAAPVTTLVVQSMEPALVSAAWLPWQLALTRRVLITPRRWAGSACALGVVVGLVVLGGHLPCLPIAVFVCGVYALFHLTSAGWQEGATAMLRLGGRFTVTALVAVGISAVQLFPTAELSRRSQRAGAFETVEAAAFDLAGDPHRPGLVLASLFDPLPMRFGYADELFLGTVTVPVALLALVDRSVRRRAAVLWGLAVLTLLISYGTATPVFGWYYRLQGGSFRIPQRFVVATALCLAVLAALGAEAFRRDPRARRLLVVLCAAAALGLWWLARSGPQHAGLAPYIRAPGFVASYRFLLRVGLAAAPLAVLPATWVRGWLAPLAILTLAGFSADQMHGSFEVRMAIPATHPDALPVPVGAARFIRERAGFARIATPTRVSLDEMGRQVPVRLGMLEDLFAISDYEPLVDRRYAELLWPMSGFWGQPGNAHLGPFVSEVTPAMALSLRTLGVGYVVVPKQAGPTVSLSSPPVYSDRSVAVYALDNPLPRTYVATAVQSAATPDAARTVVLQQPEWLLSGGAVVEAAPDLQGSRGSARIRRYEDCIVEIDATLASPGLVVLGDTWDPFWEVSVDGVRQEILRTNYAFRGVRVGAGQHTLRFEYHPWLITLGAVVSVMTIIGLAVGCGWGAWRRSGVCGAPSLGAAENLESESVRAESSGRE
jgi:hypothetical protein